MAHSKIESSIFTLKSFKIDRPFKSWNRNTTTTMTHNWQDTAVLQWKTIAPTTHSGNGQTFEVCLRQGAIQIHVYLTLPYNQRKYWSDFPCCDV